MKTKMNEETLQKTKVIKRAKTFKSPLSESTPCKYLGIDKITLHEQYTQIDFVYIAPKKIHQRRMDTN